MGCSHPRKHYNIPGVAQPQPQSGRGFIRLADATLTTVFDVGVSQWKEAEEPSSAANGHRGICLRFLLAVHPPKELDLSLLLKL